jgi:hypothetical protein
MLRTAGILSHRPVKIKCYDWLNSPEAWAEQTTSWSGAKPESVDAFAAGIATLSRERQIQRPSSSHLGPLADAAESWTRYRTGARP